MEVADVFGDLPPLETERLLLRRLAVDDVLDLHAYACDPEVARLTTWEPHASTEASRAFINAVLAKYAAGDIAPWGIVLKAEGRLVGTSGFVYWNPQHGRAEVGCALARRLWGRGLMTEAVRRACAFGFEVMGCNRIEALCLPENVASARLMEKVGMRFEGVLRECAWTRGPYRDRRLYSVLRRQWRAEAPSTPRQEEATTHVAASSITLTGPHPHRIAAMASRRATRSASSL